MFGKEHKNAWKQFTWFGEKRTSKKMSQKTISYYVSFFYYKNLQDRKVIVQISSKIHLKSKWFHPFFFLEKSKLHDPLAKHEF